MEIIRTDLPKEREWRAAEALCAACNSFDGTDYTLDEADDYYFLTENGNMLSALLVYHMGDTLDGDEIDEILAFTLPEERGNGFFTGLLKEAEPELRGVLRFSVYENPDALRTLESLGAIRKNEEIMMVRELGAVPDETAVAGCAGCNGCGGDCEGEIPVREGCYRTDHAELSYRAGGDSAYIYGVSAFERGKGYGTELMEKAGAFFRRAGIRTMLLEVSSDNTAAVRLYEKTGFQRAVTIACWYLRTRCPKKTDVV